MNKPLANLGTIEFTDKGIVGKGDFSALKGLKVEVRPVKVQARTVLSEIGKISGIEGKKLTKEQIIFGNPSVSDMVVTLKEMNPADRETAINALSGANPDRYENLVSFLSSKIPGKLDFTVIAPQ